MAPPPPPVAAAVRERLTKTGARHARRATVVMNTGEPRLDTLGNWPVLHGEGSAGSGEQGRGKASGASEQRGALRVSVVAAGGGRGEEEHPQKP